MRSVLDGALITPLSGSYPFRGIKNLSEYPSVRQESPQHKTALMFPSGKYYIGEFSGPFVQEGRFHFEVADISFRMADCYFKMAD